MSGLTSTLSIAKTALAAQQYSLNITGQNIANVNNENYSVQNAEHKNRTPSPYAGFLFGTGVDMYQIQQQVNSLLEQRLTDEISGQSSLDEQESYMRILEGFFDVNSDTSINTLLEDFWGSWHDLANNPEGSAERVTILENGQKVAQGLSSVAESMDGLSQDITREIEAAIIQVNNLSSQIADLNLKIASSEINRSANDLRDIRNGLIDDLGALIDITTYEHSNGSVTVNAANAYTLVSNDTSYSLSTSGQSVVWKGGSGTVEISDKILGGRIGGLLTMRDEVLPKYRTEIDELSREMIWAINYQHSQGAGLDFIQEPVTGTYSTNDDRWLTGFDFGDKIDASKAFSLWMEDKTRATAEYTNIQMDMGLSEASITDWEGVAPGGTQSIYKLTVVDDAQLGDKIVSETDGDGLGQVFGDAASTTVADTLNQAITNQTLTLYNGPSGTQDINIKDVGGDAKRSAASIAEALNLVDGVQAYASTTQANFDITNIVNAQDGDEVRFTLYVDGVLKQADFVRNSNLGTLQEQFEDALLDVAQAVNTTNEDDDLFADGLTITSESGRTLGIQDFEVVDNAAVSLEDFLNFDSSDTVNFTVDSMNGSSAASTTFVSVDLAGVDTTDQTEMALAFSTALSSALEGRSFSVTHDPDTDAVVIRTTDGTDIRLRDADGDTGNDGTIALTSLSGTTDDLANPDSVLNFNGANDTARFNAATTSSDDLYFYDQGTGVTVNESSAVGQNRTAVITGTVTMTMESEMTVRTTVFGAGTGGLFMGNYAKTGSSILTFGGEGGFSGFSTAGGEVIEFELDGTTISIPTTAGTGLTDLELAALFKTEIENDLAAAGKGLDYQVILTASSVSVLKSKDLDDPIAITNFRDSLGNNAKVSVRTGTGDGINQPENDVLEADPTRSYRNGTTSSLYSDKGQIRWERLDKNGVRTGDSGFVTVEDEGRVTIVEDGVETLSFMISEGSLVAGNTLTVNTDTTGHPDPLDFRVTGRANSINDIYRFEVISGGKVGHLPTGDDPPLVIEWSNGVESGTFTIEGHDPPYTPESPVEVTVDGMNLKFTDGTLFDDDVFTITTGDTGLPLSENSAGQATGEKLNDWHWTLDSFSEQFNRLSGGVTASGTHNNQLKFEASDSYYAMENVEYSGSNGFDEENVTITVTDWSAVDFKISDLRFERSGAKGSWGVVNDPTGGDLKLIPEGGDDDGFGIDLSGDGFADIRIDFTERVTGNGFVEFDFHQRDAADIGFAFSDDQTESSGLAAAAGINTFFTGKDALSMAVNETLNDTRRIAAATIDADTGMISQGDNTNALDMADVQYKEIELALWNYARGTEAASSTTYATIDEYFTQMISSLGVTSRSIKNEKEYADMMVNSITEQRNSVSAVSLDEEMIKLIKYQHAYSAASKLLTVSDEMLNTLISMR